MSTGTATSTKPNLSPDPVKSGMANTMKSSTLLQLYYQVVTTQPDIFLPSEIDTATKTTVSKDLPRHQALARDNAQYYMSTINPMMVRSLSDIIGFGNTWNSMHGRLVQLAGDLDSGNNKRVFTDGMNDLKKKVDQNAVKCTPIITELNNFLPKITLDARNFGGDKNTVDSWMKGQGGYLSTLQSELDAIDKAISDDNAMIAGGSAMIVGGIALIVVGAVSTVVTGGAAAAVVVGGIALAGGGIAMTAAAGVDLANKTSAKRDKLTKLNQAQQVYGLVQNGASNIDNMLTAINGGIAAVIELQKGWNFLKDNFGQVTASLDSADPDLPSWLKEQLNAANTNWGDTLTLAKSLQSNGTIAVAGDRNADFVQLYREKAKIAA